MNTRNPTPLRVGMRGQLLGQPCRIAGRVLLGMEEEGVTYYWNEFNVVTDDGESMTLVYEVTDNGPEWRVFRMFEPDYPITAEDAATKRVGDIIYLQENGLTITVVDESRVYYIEGEAPEGVQTGDVAKYFNAENGGQMDVVSWTGEEVECYHGQTVTAETVSRAFGIASTSFSAAPLRAGATVTGKQFPKVLLIVAMFAGVLLLLVAKRSSRQSEGIKTVPAPVLNAPLGRTISVNGQPGYAIQGRHLFQVQQVNLTFRQFRLEMSEGSVLVTPLQPGSEALMRFAEPPAMLTPYKAASLRTGDQLTIAGEQSKIVELFTCQPEIPDPATGQAFGCLAHGRTNVYLIQWNEKQVWVLAGKPVKEGSITGALRK